MSLLHKYASYTTQDKPQLDFFRMKTRITSSFFLRRNFKGYRYIIVYAALLRYVDIPFNLVYYSLQSCLLFSPLVDQAFKY